MADEHTTSAKAKGTMKDMVELAVENGVKQGATAAVYPNFSKKVENTPAILKETVETALGRFQKVRGQESDNRAEAAEKSKEMDEIYKAGCGPGPGSPQSGLSAGDSFRTLSAEFSDGEAGWDVMASLDTIKAGDFFAPAEMTEQIGGLDLRIEEPIEALSAVGFKEEQGILRKLLDDFGGDISMVFDKLNKLSK
ncbi:hypothetical protein RvY_00833 [Ramazzottius varieornatus]|uniref:UBA domain-containing protein n=1 Tax=Ramazzottius varieornatus TaxID=947166 RepID=A0A1D1UE58_RAMVA|nr:hypothetical protein RvY_00833 [Ramazzottius varieornatus]